MSLSIPDQPARPLAQRLLSALAADARIVYHSYEYLYPAFDEIDRWLVDNHFPDGPMYLGDPAIPRNERWFHLALSSTERFDVLGLVAWVDGRLTVA